MQQDSSPKNNPFNIVSFSYGYRSSNKNEAILQHPGVGDYNVGDESPKSAGMKFHQSHRHDPAKAKLFIPGPGAYNLASKAPESPSQSAGLKASFMGFPSKSASMSIDKRSKAGNSLLELKPIESKASATSSSGKKRAIGNASFVAAHDQKYSSEFSTPGPGTYNVREPYESPGKKKLGALIGTGERDVLGINSASKIGIPGPLYYSHNFGDIIGTGNQPGSFTKDKRHPDNGLVSPGPGDYEQDLQSSPEKGEKKGTFGSDRRILTKIRNKNFPGPQEYNDTYDKFGTKNILLSQSKRPGITTKNPGVGDYDIIDGFSAIKKEAEKRAAFKQMMMTLSTTLSESPCDVTSISASFLSRSKSIDQSMNLNVRSNYVFLEPLRAKPTKDTWVDTMIYNDPSPGPVYAFGNKSISEGKPGGQFKKQPRLPINDVEIKANVPGPGSYVENLVEPVKTDLGMGLPRGRRPSDSIIPLHVRKNPGVGDYETELRKAIQGGSMGIADRGLGVK